MNVPEYYDRVAKMQGYNENDQNRILTEFMANGGVNLDPAETAWCAGVVNATLQQSGIEGTGSLMARDFMEWGQGVDTPQVGDVAVFNRPAGGPGAGHVGFYSGTNPDGTIRVLGGNQGDAVSYDSYSPDRLLGYRRPGPEGVTVPASAISGAPGSYPGGGIVPVSGASNVNQTLPPPMSSVDLSPIDPAKYETPSFTQALATNPFVQMGLGMLGSTSPGMRGLQEGLLGAAAAENAFQRSGTDRMKMEQSRRWQQLNLMQQQQDQSGGVVPAAQQARELLARERMQNELYLAAQAARTAAAGQRDRYNMTLPDGTTRAVELAPGDDLPEGAVLTKIGTPAKGQQGGKRAQRQEDALTVLTRLDELDALIEANPETVSPLARPKLALGKLLGGIADETGNPKLRDWAERKLKTTTTSSVNLGLASAVTDAAKWIVNKGDTRMSNNDVARAEEIMDRKGFLTDSATTRQALNDLRAIIAPYAHAPEGTPPTMTESPPIAGEPDWDSMTLEEIQAYGR